MGQRQAGHAQLQHSLAQLAVAVFFGIGIQGHCHAGAFANNLFNQVGQHGLWTEFHEDLAAVGIDAFDFVFEQHRIENMARQNLADLIGTVAVFFAAGVGIQRSDRRIKGCFFNGVCEGLLGVFHQGGVEGGGNRQEDHRIAFAAQGFLHLRDGGLAARQDHLGVGIPVGQGDFRIGLDFLGNLHRIGFNRQHGAGVKIGVERCGRHGLPARFGQGEIILVVEHPGSPERCQFAKTVPGHKVRLKPGLLQQLV